MTPREVVFVGLVSRLIMQPDSLGQRGHTNTLAVAHPARQPLHRPRDDPAQSLVFNLPAGLPATKGKD